MSSETTEGSESAASPGADAPAADRAPDPSPSPARAEKRHAPPWPDWLRDVAVSLCRWLARPRVRLTGTGLILLVGGVLVTGSVWTFPLVIAGAVMVVIAWVGHRLDGRFAIEWGETGAQLEFRAQMRAPEHDQRVLAEAAPRPHPLARGAEPEPEPEDADVVEGEAHTVEIEVGELKALIAAAEFAEAAEIAAASESAAAETAQAQATEHAARILRVAHGAGRSSDTAG